MNCILCGNKVIRSLLYHYKCENHNIDIYFPSDQNDGIIMFISEFIANYFIGSKTLIVYDYGQKYYYDIELNKLLKTIELINVFK